MVDYGVGIAARYQVRTSISYLLLSCQLSDGRLWSGRVKPGGRPLITWKEVWLEKFVVK